MAEGDFDLGGGWAARVESNADLSIFHNRGGVRLSMTKVGELGAWYSERLAALDAPPAESAGEPKAVDRRTRIVVGSAPTSPSPD